MRWVVPALLLACWAVPAMGQSVPAVTARFLTSPPEAGIYQQVSSAERPGRYLGRSDKTVVLDARGSQLRLIFRAPGFQDYCLTVPPGYFYQHHQWPEQGVLQMTPDGWRSWFNLHPWVWITLAGLSLVWARRARPVLALPPPLGGYRLLSLLGEGGCSKVYRALPQSAPTSGCETPVAIKIYTRAARPQANPAGHAGIVQTYHCGHDQGKDYLIMELLPGGTLRAQFKPQGVPLATARHWVSQLVSALQFAHGQGVVHADLKPENILISDTGRLKLTDFAGASQLLGTPAYLAPEQLLRQPVGDWTDQYGLALLTYEMLTGSLPAGGLVRSFQPLPRGRLEARLEEVLQRMLQKDVQDRYPGFREAGLALLEVL